MTNYGQIGSYLDTCREKIFEWYISNFLSYSTITSGYYTSPTFSFDNTQWYLILYPNQLVESKEWVSLYLTRGNSGPPKSMTYTMGIKVSDGVKKKVFGKFNFSRQGDRSGSSQFLPISDLRSWNSVLIPNNILTVTCRLRSQDSVYTDQAVQTVNVGEGKLQKSLLRLLESGDDSDVIIKVRGKEFPAHRNILRARSPVFESMFTHEMVEKNSGVVKIEDCDPDTFHDFLAHIYSGSCDQIDTENAYSLYTNADKYDVGELKEACSEFMKSNISVGSFYHVIALAVKHNDEGLTECATNFFCDNSVDIAKTTAWQTFLMENAIVGNELFIKAISKYVALLKASTK